MNDNSIEYYLGLPYTVELRRDANAGWFVRVRELPGCMSQADTAEEALRSIQEVLPLWLETALEDGYAIPEPRQAEEYSGKFVIRVPRSLHRELAETAEREGVSLNQYVSTALARAAGQTSQAPAPAEDPSRAGTESFDVVHADSGRNRRRRTTS